MVCWPTTATATTIRSPPPWGNDDSYSVLHDRVLVVAPTQGVLANDWDMDGDWLTLSLVSNPTNGTLSLKSNGAFVYTPNAGFRGTDSFSYKVSDGIADSNVATVTLVVGNTAPFASADSYMIPKNGLLTVDRASAGVLAND